MARPRQAWRPASKVLDLRLQAAAEPARPGGFPPARPGRGPAAAGSSREEARKLGCCKLTLEVLEGNAVARSLYRSCGFEGYELKAETGKAMFMHKPLA
jgi:hypothetical protein